MNFMQNAEERPVRSLAKAVTWRLVGTMDTFLISWILTGKPLLASGIALSELFTKSFLYYLHERGWSNVQWGYKKPKSEYDSF
jgi:uncharacterized membrane protein